MEQLEKAKADFETKNTALETEKAALNKCAEAAEGQLQPVAEELVGLKRHVTQMTQAIFGK